MMRSVTATAVLGLFLGTLGIPLAHADPQSNTYRIPSDVNAAGGGEEAKSNNYMLIDTIGEPNIGDSESNNYGLNAGYRQTLETFISISGPPTIDLGTITGTGQRSASGTFVVITDAQAGYSLAWQASSATMISGSDSIAAFTPATPNVPDTWTVASADSEWGGRLRSSSTDSAAEWGTDNSTDKWLNVATSSRTIVTRGTRTSVAGSSEILDFRGEVGSSHIQPNGTYTVTVTLTATSL